MKLKRSSVYKTYHSKIDTYYKIITYHRTVRNGKEYELWRTKNAKGSKIISIKKNLIYNVE